MRPDYNRDFGQFTREERSNSTGFFNVSQRLRVFGANLLPKSGLPTIWNLEMVTTSFSNETHRAYHTPQP